MLTKSITSSSRYGWTKLKSKRVPEKRGNYFSNDRKNFETDENTIGRSENINTQIDSCPTTNEIRNRIESEKKKESGGRLAKKRTALVYWAWRQKKEVRESVREDIIEWGV